MGTLAEILIYVVAAVAFAWLARRLLGADRVSWRRALIAGTIGGVVGGLTWWSMIQIDVDDDAAATGVAIVTALIVTMGLIVAMQLVSGRRATTTPRIGPAASARAARRSAEVTGIAVRHGLGPYVGRRDTGATAPLPDRVREALEESGTVFVKFGQLLAGRPDLVGDVMATELAELQHRVTPLDRDVMEPVLRAAIDGFDDRVASIDWEPLGSASIAQVYAARLADGSDVVIKARRPGIVDEVRRDGQVIRDVTQLVEQRSEWARTIGLADLAAAFVDDLLLELDYAHETRAAAELATTFDDGTIEIPDIHEELGGDGVIVMERIAGSSLADADLDHLSDDVRASLAAHLVAAQITAMLDGGRFHADLHPGNVMLAGNDRIAFIDFGATGLLSMSEQGALASLLLGLRLREPTMLRDSLLEVSDSDGTVDTARLDRALGHLLAEHIRPDENLDAGAVIELLQIMRDHGLRLPPSSSSMFRGLVTVLASVERLAPGLAVLDKIDEVGEVVSPLPSNPSEFAELVREETVRMLPVLRRAPRLADSISTQLDRGDLSIRVRAFSHPDDVRVMTRLVNRAVLGFVAVGLGIVSAMLFGLDKGPYLGDNLSVYDVLASIGLLAGALLVMRVVMEALDHDDP